MLGGGALGLAAAIRLAEAGCRVTIVEREPQLGGLAVGFRVGPSSLEKFYHHIFRTDRTIIRFIEERGLSHKLQWSRPNTSVLWHRQIAGVNSPLDVLRLPFLSPISRLRLAAASAYLKMIPNERSLAGITAGPWIRRHMGAEVYEKQWGPLLRGKFGDRAEDVAMSWFWSRIHERTFELGYLRGGFQQLYDALGARVEELGGRVLLGTSVDEIAAEDGGVRVCTAGAGALRFDATLVTLPTRLFTELARGLPESWIDRYPGPDHYGAHVVVLGLDRPLTDGVYWLNVNDRDFPFLALVEHTNLVPPEDYGGLHLVYLGNYLPMDHWLFRASDEEAVREMVAGVRLVRPDFQDEWIKRSWVFKAPYAQPIVTTDYLAKLPPHETPLEGVYLANMAHVYPQDRGQNYSLRLGEQMARLLL